MTPFSSATYAARIARVQQRMCDHDVDALLLSVGADLPYFTGYRAMPLERLTMLVVPCDGMPTLVVPQLEAERVTHHDTVFAMRSWNELEDPIAIVSSLLGAARTVAIGDHTWARFVIDLASNRHDIALQRATALTSPLRARKDAEEFALLQAAGAAVDRCVDALRQLRMSGKTERAIQRELETLILDHGHEHVDFAIVATGSNAASPHHEPTDRVVREGDVVLCDFGGTRDGYCSDITRCFSVGGEAPARIADAWNALREAHATGVHAGAEGVSAAAVDARTRAVLEAAGYGEWFIHRTGHGIGTETHEDPYIVASNLDPLVTGNAYSVEPGIYIPNDFGLRLEDIVILTDQGPETVTNAPRELMVVE
jgi:Xaa-Pro aminopeptidase